MTKFSIALATTALVLGSFVLSDVAVAHTAKHHHKHRHHKHRGEHPCMTPCDENPFAGKHFGISFGGNKASGAMRMEASSESGLYQAKAKQSAIGMIGGVNLDCNHFFGRYLLGLEVSADTSNLVGKRHLGVQNGTGSLDLDFQARMRWQVTAGLRAGILLAKDVLGYGHVDWVGSRWHVNGMFNLQPPPMSQQLVTVSDSRFRHGVRTGIGMAKYVACQTQIGMDLAYTWYERTGKFAGNAFNTDGTFFSGSSGVIKTKFRPRVFEARAFIKFGLKGIS